PTSGLYRQIPALAAQGRFFVQFQHPCLPLLHPCQTGINNRVFHRVESAVRIDRTEANESKRAITSKKIHKASQMNFR
ncbi:MAG: hypothetical protein ACK4M6_12220, partial [Hyphomonas sp.]